MAQQASLASFRKLGALYAYAKKAGGLDGFSPYQAGITDEAAAELFKAPTREAFQELARKYFRPVVHRTRQAPAWVDSSPARPAQAQTPAPAPIPAGATPDLNATLQALMQGMTSLRADLDALKSRRRSKPAPEALAP